MKRNIPLLIISVLLSLVAFAIAIPTINELNIRGLDPKDIGLNFINQYFAFQPSTDLQGGKLITLNVPLAETDNTKTQQLDKVKFTLYYRLWNAGIKDFSINVESDNAQVNNKILIKAPASVNESTMGLLLSPANFSVWVQDPTATDNVAEGTMDAILRQMFGKRYQLNITNSDVDSINIVSDSRCYNGNASTTINYCIDIHFNSTAQKELAQAIASVPVQTEPIIIALDYSVVGIKATGQTFYDATSLGSELLIYTGYNDELTNRVIASMIGSEPLNSTVKLEKIENLSPIMGDNTLTKIKIALVLSIIAANALIIYYFRKRGVVFTFAFAMFAVYTIALMKVTNMTLSFGLIGGFVITALLYTAILISTEYRIRTAYKGHLTEIELKEIYSAIAYRLRNLTFVVLMIAFIMSIFYAPILAINFINGLGVAMIGALIVHLTIFNAVLPFFLLNKKHE